jgi:hypothetical protein
MNFVKRAKSFRSGASEWAAMTLIILAAGHLHAQQGLPGEIDGFILDESNQPVAGAVVTFTRMFAADTLTPLPANGVVSQPDGSFFFAGLPAGAYRICAQLNGGSLLNPCEWSSEPPLVAITAGQVLPGVKIALQQGVQVNVRVDDPNQVLPRPGKANKGNEVIVGIWTKSGFHDVPRVFQDSAGQNHLLVVPSSVALRLKVYNHSLPVRASDGLEVPATLAPTPFQLQKGDPPALFHFRITGN